MAKRSFLFLSLFAFALLFLFCAQEMTVPVELQYQLFMKILEYDRNIKVNGGDEIVIGVIFQQMFRLSALAEERFLALHQENPEPRIGNVPVRCVPVALTNASSLQEALQKDGIQVVYVAPLRAFDIKAIAEICRKQKITSLTGVTDYLNSGLAVSIGLQKEKPKIMINLSAAKAGGSDFSSQLLNLAEIIQ